MAFLIRRRCRRRSKPPWVTSGGLSALRLVNPIWGMRCQLAIDEGKQFINLDTKERHPGGAKPCIFSQRCIAVGNRR